MGVSDLMIRGAFLAVAAVMIQDPGGSSLPFTSTADCDVLRDAVLVLLGVGLSNGVPGFLKKGGANDSS